MSNTIKAERATIQLGDISINVYRLPDGSYRLSGRNITDAAQEPANSLLRVMGLKSIKELPGAQQYIPAMKDGGPFWGLTPDVAAMCWATLSAHRKNLVAYDLVVAINEDPCSFSLPDGFSIPIAKPSNIQRLERCQRAAAKRNALMSRPENHIENKLTKHRKDCQRQVATPVGVIDVLTSTEVIEVKQFKGWKAALGQVLVYGNQYPSHSKRIHLFGSAHPDVQLLIERECAKFNVVVTWDKNDEN